MYVVSVHILVKPEQSASVLEATLETAKNTVTSQATCVRRDSADRRTRPVRVAGSLRDEAGMKAHKETPHYAQWAAAVAPWMAEPRKGVRYATIRRIPSSGRQRQRLPRRCLRTVKVRRTTWPREPAA